MIFLHATRKRPALLNTNDLQKPAHSDLHHGSYAGALLTTLGVASQQFAEHPDDPDTDWATSGLRAWCAPGDIPDQVSPLPSCARGALDALRAIAERNILPDINGATLLTERAGRLGLEWQGQTSANGSCRLLAASGGWIALNLARTEDVELLPAWLEVSPADLPNISEHLSERFPVGLSDLIQDRPQSLLVERGRLLGLPVAALGECRDDAWITVTRLADPAPRRRPAEPLVIDLSGLWAGPLCTNLLALAGARIIKVESLSRPDAARRGTPEFFDLLNGGKESVLLDLPRPSAVAQLKALLSAADIVVESARPRALRQMGIDAAEMVRSVRGLCWVGLTGYGRQPVRENRVAFGDDAAVAAGLVTKGPTFCGDAICDPLTGLHAAVAALCHCGAGGVLLDVSLAGVGATCARFGASGARFGAPRARFPVSPPAASTLPMAEPKLRPVTDRARPLGSDTARVLREFGCC